MVGGHSQGKGEDNTSTEMTGEARRCPPKKYLQLLLAGIIVIIIVVVSVLMANRGNSGHESQCYADIRDTVLNSNYTSAADLDGGTSAQNSAIRWLAHDDDAPN